MAYKGKLNLSPDNILVSYTDNFLEFARNQAGGTMSGDLQVVAVKALGDKCARCRVVDMSVNNAWDRENGYNQDYPDVCDRCRPLVREWVAANGPLPTKSKDEKPPKYTLEDYISFFQKYPEADKDNWEVLMRSIPGFYAQFWDMLVSMKVCPRRIVPNTSPIEYEGYCVYSILAGNDSRYWPSEPATRMIHFLADLELGEYQKG